MDEETAHGPAFLGLLPKMTDDHQLRQRGPIRARLKLTARTVPGSKGTGVTRPIPPGEASQTVARQLTFAGPVMERQFTSRLQTLRLLSRRSGSGGGFAAP